VGFSSGKKHNLSFLYWDSICHPKALGGLGICSIEFLNNSLLAQLGWKMTILLFGLKLFVVNIFKMGFPFWMFLLILYHPGFGKAC
jgi:hypothetical protein